MQLKYMAILICLLIVSYSAYTQRSITRGSEPGEIYIASDMHPSGYSIKYGIFRSTDYGKHLDLRYDNLEVPPPGEMNVAKVLGDATAGVLYNWGFHRLWKSMDYGENWEFLENYGSSGRFTSGCLEGEIYKNCTDVYGTIFRSTDFGNTFDTISQSENTKFPLEVGLSEGEVYGRSSIEGGGYNLHYSVDYGLSFTTNPIDSSVAFYGIEYQPEIHRGTEIGELFLVSWWSDYHFKIFHSTDHGYTWDFNYESEFIHPYYWTVKYTAGKSPGSFYVLRIRINPSYTGIWLYIDHSDDYGQTFTTYFHDLGTWVGIPSIKDTRNKIEILLFPNPVNQLLNINLQADCNNEFNKIMILDVLGRVVENIELSGAITDYQVNVSNYDPGIYLVTFFDNNQIYQSEKFVVEW